MKKLKIYFLAFVVMLLFSISWGTIPAYATGAGSQADSPGTSGAKPLGFISCTLEDGSKIDAAEGITLQPRFKFEFDKNVVNMLVWENNSKCFSLSLDNVIVPIIVGKIDDTVDPDSKQLIFMHPKNALLPGKTYCIKISPKLLAKNLNSTLEDSTNGQGITLTFKTKGQAAPENANTGAAAKNTPTSIVNNTSNSSSAWKMTSNNWVELTSGIVILCWIITEFFIKRRIKKGRNNKPLV